MATEKDKTKAAAVKMYLDEHPALGKDGPVDWEQIEFAMRFADAARADAIEECAKAIELRGRSCVDYGHHHTKCAPPFNCSTLANLAITLRSLSRKQEEPR